MAVSGVKTAVFIADTEHLPTYIFSVYVSTEQMYSQPEWSRELTVNSDWREAQVSFTTHTQLRVAFAAELHKTHSGIALDDITITAGTCQGGETYTLRAAVLCYQRDVIILVIISLIIER